MKKSERAKIVKKILDRSYPNTPVPLDHKDNFTLLIAVLLSAQCTDERVNKVTPALFKKFPDAVALANADIEELENLLMKELIRLHQNYFQLLLLL